MSTPQHAPCTQSGTAPESAIELLSEGNDQSFHHSPFFVASGNMSLNPTVNITNITGQQNQALPTITPSELSLLKTKIVEWGRCIARLLTRRTLTRGIVSREGYTVVSIAPLQAISITIRDVPLVTSWHRSKETHERYSLPTQYAGSGGSWAGPLGTTPLQRWGTRHRPRRCWHAFHRRGF
jgi:hypothetical protein